MLVGWVVMFSWCLVTIVLWLFELFECVVGLVVCVSSLFFGLGLGFVVIVSLRVVLSCRVLMFACR